MTVRQGTYFPAKECSGGATRTLQLAQAYFLARFPGTTNGGLYNCRNIAGSDKLSVHGAGRAGDLMTGTGRPTLETRYLAEQMRLFSEEAGLQGVIFNRRQWFCNRPTWWREYNGSNPHVDHIHYEFRDGVSLSASHFVHVFQGPAPTGNALFANGKVVARGMSGQHVSYVQTRLNAHGFGLKLDGLAGPLTIAAVTTFQKLAGLVPDGIAGPKTQGRLQ